MNVVQNKWNVWKYFVESRTLLWISSVFMCTCICVCVYNIYIYKYNDLINKHSIAQVDISGLNNPIFDVERKFERKLERVEKKIMRG